MLTILKPKSYQALQEIERFREEMSKAGILDVSEPIEEPEASESAQILTWDVRDVQLLKEKFPSARVAVLPPGVDTRIRTLREEPRPYDVLRIVTILDICQENGYDLAVRLLQSLGDIDWHWYVVGEPMDEYYFEVLTKKFDEWGWEDRVSFVGKFPLDERIELAVNMDVALHLPRCSPLSLPLLELVQMGLPILATKVGYAEAILSRDEEALLGDDGSLAKAFLMKYAGLKTTRRKKRDHPLLTRKWSQVAEEYRLISAGIPSD